MCIPECSYERKENNKILVDYIYNVHTYIRHMHSHVYTHIRIHNDTHTTDFSKEIFLSGFRFLFNAKNKIHKYNINNIIIAHVQSEI